MTYIGLPTILHCVYASPAVVHRDSVHSSSEADALRRDVVWYGVHVGMPGMVQRYPAAGSGSIVVQPPNKPPSLKLTKPRPTFAAAACGGTAASYQPVQPDRTSLSLPTTLSPQTPRKLKT